jgi:membrane protein insertase Oxa1/YidC/SpoIIIJ
MDSLPHVIVLLKAGLEGKRKLTARSAKPERGGFQRAYFGKMLERCFWLVQNVYNLFKNSRIVTLFLVVVIF